MPNWISNRLAYKSFDSSPWTWGLYVPKRIIQLACLGSGKVMRKFFEMSFDPQIISDVFLVPVPQQDKISNNLVLTKFVIAPSKYNWLDKAKDKLI